MAKPWVLTRQAEGTLAGIAEWTFETFGRRQTEAYAEDLIAACQALADGTLTSRDCRRLVSPDLTEDLRFARVGQHYVVFVYGTEQMIVVDFLHVRMDLPARLASLGAGETRV